MANPQVTVQLDKPSYLPGDQIVVSWTVIDADNSTLEIAYEGTDSQGNPVNGTIIVNRLDPFTMNRVYWVASDINLTINQAARTATGTVPTSP